MDAAALDWVGCCDHDNGGGREYTWWLTQKFTDVYTAGRAVLANVLLRAQRQLSRRPPFLLTFAPFFSSLWDDLTAIAHKHLIPNDISCSWAKCGVSKWEHFSAS